MVTPRQWSQLSSVSVCCLPREETIGVYGGFSTSPILTATHVACLCQVKATWSLNPKADYVCHSVLHAYRLFLESAGNQPVSTKVTKTNAIKQQAAPPLLDNPRCSFKNKQESCFLSGKFSCITIKHNNSFSSLAMARNEKSYFLSITTQHVSFLSL